jgi:RNA polymerase sigma factor (sigma-70 family)
VPGLVDHFFRHEYGRLVATLTRIAGLPQMERAEDAVQAALMTALTEWTANGLPSDPGGWLYRVAHNRLIGDLRQGADRARLLARNSLDLAPAPPESPPHHFASEVRDDLLRMLFVCCDEAIPWESRLVLALKTLCGFATDEIAQRLFISEANVHKRLERARNRLRDTSLDFATPPLEQLSARLPGVHAVLYLLFNEGYLSLQADRAIRHELCEEAIRLTSFLAEHPVGAVPETFALLALMHSHTARLASRQDGAGGMLLLGEQDRSLWDHDRIRVGSQWLARSADGEVFSRYHAEAGIAAEHCMAPSFAATRWREIAELYAILEHIVPSPLHTLNRAVAVAEWQGAQAGLALLDDLRPPTWLSGSHLWDAVLSDLHRRAGNLEISARHRVRAIESAPTPTIADLLRRRLGPAD